VSAPIAEEIPEPIASPQPVVNEFSQESAVNPNPKPIELTKPIIEEPQPSAVLPKISNPEPLQPTPSIPKEEELPAPVPPTNTPSLSKGFGAFKPATPAQPEVEAIPKEEVTPFEEPPLAKEIEPEPIPTPSTPSSESLVVKPAPVTAAANKLSFSAPVMGGQENIDHIRLEIYHEIIRACGTLKKISRAEATSLINITSRAPDGLILPHVSKMISIPPDALQADLLSKDNLAFVPVNFFANVLRTTKFEKIRRLLIPYGIVPLFSKDAIITCAMELPHLRDVVIEVSNRHSLGFKWCHAIMFKIKDLQDALTG
jgi:hypothetical protein